MTYDYYAEEEPGEYDDDSFIGKITSIDKKKLAIILVLLLLLIGGTLVATGVINPSILIPIDPNDTDKISFTSEAGVKLKVRGSATTEEGDTDTFNTDGTTLDLTTNPNNSTRVSISTTGLPTGLSGGTVTIIGPDGNPISTSTNVTYDETGQLILILDPELDLGLDGNLNDYEGTESDYTFQVTLTDNNTGEEVVFEIPANIGFAEFVGTGCIALTRSSVSETTHFGALELEVKLRILCETEDDLVASVDWSSNNMGPVEVLFDKKYSAGTSLVADYQTIKENPSTGEYVLRIYFVPTTMYAGKRAKFDVDFKLGNAEQTIKFDVAVENLEQCISVTSDDPIITSDSDEANIFIDAKNCASRKINIYLCDGDYGCGGGTDEGVIDLDNGYFSLVGGKSKSVKVTRGDIAGVYGVSVHASIPGMEKTFIDEKEITVLPTTEYVYPEEFVVSLLKNGTRDSVVVRNTLLAEDVDVEASVCDLYSSSVGESDNESWLFKMYGNYDYYAGEGLYVAGLTDAIAAMDGAMFSALTLSDAENFLIKEAYLAISDLDDDADDLLNDSQLAQNAADDLDDALNDVVDTGDYSLASGIVGLVTSLATLVTEVTALQTSATAAASTSEGITTCAKAQTAHQKGTGYLENVNSTSPLLYAEVLQLYTWIDSLYSLWQTIEASTADDQTINAESAVENAEAAGEKIAEVEEKTESALDYALLGLEAAAIDALDSASSDDLDAKGYFELAKSDMSEIKDLLDEAVILNLTAYDAITTAIAEEPEDWEIGVQIVSLLLQIIGQFPVALTKAEYIETSLLAAQESYAEALPLAAADCTASTTPPYSGESACCGYPAAIAPLQTEVAALIGEIEGTKVSLLNYLSVANTLYQAFELYQSLSRAFADELTATHSTFGDLTTALNTIQPDAYLAYTDIETAITSAQKLVTYEKESSDAATYNFDNYVNADFDEKRRMQGLIGSIISTGFVDGAKKGGVYSTSDTLGAADCENKVEMKLPDYQINLIKDASQVTVYNNDIIAQWDFSEAQVYDFFKEQEVAINFSDNGLSENSYAIVELPIKKHSHAPTTLVNGDFGPFNIPDSGVEDLTYKYHFKFNMEERKSANPTKSPVCEKGILFGETGDEAGAQTILSWDWNSINSASVEGKYIDATQLSILIAKKLNILDNFFKRVGASCPDNYAYDVARSVTPTDIELTGSVDCYLPLSTKYYEGKPSLYHQLDYVVDSSDWPVGYDPFFDEPIISNAQEFINVVDFNVNLMLDGYGTNFQDDFSDEYTRSLFKSNPSFTDPISGSYKYFNNDNIFFYSSKSKGYQKDDDFVLPDAGKYRVRILIDFDGINPMLFSAGATKANIIIDLELIEPINKDFSPLYYTPYDGTVGLKINNNRKDYGSALTSGTNFDIDKFEGIFLTTDQKDSLAMLTHTKLVGFTWLNTLASRRSKVLDYSYTVENGANVVFSPTTATPILMKINGPVNTVPYLTYQVTKNRDALTTNSNSLFLWNGIDGCNDFYGGPLNQLINNTPDFQAGDFYGMFFSQPNDPGTVYLKTVAYTPVDEAYGLTTMGDGSIITTNNLIPVDGVIQLDGISNMPYNDLPNNSKIDSLQDIFNSVDQGAMCVSQLGNREIYWWPEEYLYEKQNAKGDNLRDQEIAAKALCIR